MYRIIVITAVALCITVKKFVKTPVDKRIIQGGRDAAVIENLPYQLSFQNYSKHYCGATLIMPNIAVTAAHCTEKFKSTDLINLSIRAGSAIRDNGGELSRISAFCDHPKYNFPDYDVSVIILSRKLPITTAIHTVPLQPPNTNVETGTIATVSGWGQLSYDGPFARILQVLDVPKISQEDCQSYYDEEDINDRMFCFGYGSGGMDSCQGDSGGPLIVEGHLAGIVSWGYGCGFPELPGIYARVANKEIYDHIIKCSKKYN